MDNLYVLLLFMSGAFLFVYFKRKGVQVNNSIQLLIIGEIIWMICTIIGLIIITNAVSIVLMTITMLNFLITIFSLLLTNLKLFIGKLKQTRGIKKYIGIKMADWEGQLPCGIKIKTIDFAINRYNHSMSGRVIIHLSTQVNEDLNWVHYGDLLAKMIDQPLIIKIYVNNKQMYPIFR